MLFTAAGFALARPLAGPCDDYTIGVGTANISAFTLRAITGEPNDD
jgi:hypothetical protein